jgi:hypothetical protein
MFQVNLHPSSGSLTERWRTDLQIMREMWYKRVEGSIKIQLKIEKKNEMRRRINI